MSLENAKALREALEAWQQRGEFLESHLFALRAVAAGAIRGGAGAANMIEGLLGMFFERHMLDEKRASELLALDDAQLAAAVRQRFRQLFADSQEHADAWHALSVHVRDAVRTLGDRAPLVSYPVSIRAQNRFSPVAVEQAVAALFAEWGRKPTALEATKELLKRYVRPLQQSDDTSPSREFPEVIRARLDAQRMASTMLEVLSADERLLLRWVLDATGSIEEFADDRNLSRATAYRMLARIKSLCRLELDTRSSRTRLEVLDVLRDRLT